MEYNYRTFNGDDEEQIVPLWNRCMMRDIITTERFHQKVLLDENFDSGGCFVALHEKRIIGFCLAIRRRYPYYDVGLEEGKGWITMLFVDRDHRGKGVASELVNRSETFLRAADVQTVLVSPYTPNYFLPGIDIDIYADAYSLFERLGYKTIEKIYGMERSLLDFFPENGMEERCTRLLKQGVSIEPFKPRYIVSLLDFLRRDYPGDLFRVALEKLKRSSESEEILVAVKGDEVVGFSHYDGEHFGPFAIAQAYMGRGIGPCLYYRTALAMKENGQRHLWLAWTTGHAKDFYFKLGLTTIRRHEIMEKRL